MEKNAWHPFDSGATLGKQGSEGGATIRDEEHALGARITLEGDTCVAPFAITCGIYGWMVHTCFIGLEKDACDQYDQMKHALQGLLERASSAGLEADRILMDGCQKFVETYP